jgi:hypothetical protein
MKRKKTLLQKAKDIRIKVKATNLVSKATDEEIELAIGWAIDEITLGQFTKAIWGEDTTTAKGMGGKALYYIACWLKAGIKKGIIKI